MYDKSIRFLKEESIKEGVSFRHGVRKEFHRIELQRKRPDFPLSQTVFW